VQKVFVVTKGSDDGTLLTGDHITFYRDGSVGCKEAGGWIDKEDVESAMRGVEYTLDVEYMTKKYKKLKEEMENALL
jgi:hypothetical protein